MRWKLFSLLFLIIISLTKSNKIGCLFDKDVYFAFENVTDSPTNQLIHVKGYSKYRNGWFGIGFSKNETITKDSILIMAYLPSTIVQLKNHSYETRNLTDVDILSPTIIDIPISDKKGFEFYINISKLIGKKCSICL